MAKPDKSTLKNRLFTAMTEADFALLAPSLTRVELTLGETLILPDTSIQYAWFVEDGICSVVATTAGGKQAEVGLIGRDGFVDTTAVHGTDRTPLTCVIQIAGHGWRMRADALVRAQNASATLRALLLAFAQSFFVQAAHTALAYATYSIPQRLARWLLMTQDRLGVAEIRLTHERFAMMLGVRRAGVTVAVQTLERLGLVEARRGVVVVVNRARLLDYVGDGYGSPEVEYERLIGVTVA